jgi:hypothetical protein
MIIQPVLRWNAGDSSWHMYAETYINAAGGCSQQDFTSTSVAVNVGDAIQGTLSLITNYEGADNAFVYSIIISDTTQGTESHMLAVNQDCNGLEPFQAAEGGVMEVYNVSECDDLPGSAVLFNSQSWSESTTSDPVYFTQNNFPQRAFNPSWDNRLPDGQQPFAGCTLSVSSSATGTSLSY